jgi:hypothetical protein
MLGRVRHELIVGALAITAAACVVAATADGAAAARVRHGDRDAQITDAGRGAPSSAPKCPIVDRLMQQQACCPAPKRQGDVALATLAPARAIMIVLGRAGHGASLVPGAGSSHDDMDAEDA